MEFLDVRSNEHYGVYTVKYPTDERPSVLPEGFITDRTKSVIWNEEQVDNSKKALKKWQNARKKAEQRTEDDFYTDLCEAIENAFTEAKMGVNDQQVELIYNRAYSEQHSCGYYAVIDEAEELTSLIMNFLLAGDSNDEQTGS